MVNRLNAETSPYLLQHADNPVDWWPWSTEAFAEARSRDVPVLVSIGYSACHWCHVMEHESFTNSETAWMMNQLFVNIKVDREERPDIDSIYMDALQALSGHGGWPLTMFCAPDGTPMLGGTYFPPEDRRGLPGFRTVLCNVSDLWKTRRQDLLSQGSALVSQMSRENPAPEPLVSGMVEGARRALEQAYDPQFGGFGRAPKFPQAPVLELALRLGLRDQVLKTLDAMAMGGIYDQLGGGFARYSTDERWLVPHFEKMLYDNAQLARVYTHAWQLTKDPFYRRIAVETLEYLIREVRDPDGGFYSSQDADSEGEEGRFYVWTHEEFVRLAPDATEYYGVTSDGNFEGRNVLIALNKDAPPIPDRAKLLDARRARVAPATDDKVLASWNGLAIAALAEAGAAFGLQTFTDAAVGAARFVLTKMAGPLHTYRAGQAHVTGMLEDYAYLADGLLELYNATFDAEHLWECERLVRRAFELFADDSGVLYATGIHHEKLVVRPRDVTESATPSAAAILCGVALRLSHLLGDESLSKPALAAIRTVASYMDRAPPAVPTWVSALDFHLSVPLEVAFTGGPASLLRSVVYETYIPNRVLAGGNDGRIPLLHGRDSVDPTAYVCRNFTCVLPASDPETLLAQILEFAAG